jgi:hypothetical protein
MNLLRTSHYEQGDQFGRIFTQWVIVNLGQLYLMHTLNHEKSSPKVKAIFVIF